jgi:hypothetical protein
LFDEIQANSAPITAIVETLLLQNFVKFMMYSFLKNIMDTGVLCSSVFGLKLVHFSGLTLCLLCA